MKKDRILRDLDGVCRDMIECITSTEQLVSRKRVRDMDVAQKMSDMIVDMGSLLLDLQQNRSVLSEETERLKTIARLTLSCKNLEGMVKEMRNDLNDAGAGGEQASNDR